MVLVVYKKLSWTSYKVVTYWGMNEISGDVSKRGQMEMGRSDLSFHYDIEL